MLDLVRSLQARDERGGPADRPQPRRHPDDVRPGRGDVRRQDRRGGRRGRGLRATRSTRTRSACCARSRAAASASRERALSTIPGNLPQIGTDLPTCVFVDRCPLADELCRTVVPPIVDVGGGQLDALPPSRPARPRSIEPPPIVGAGHRPRRTRAVRRRTCRRRSTRAATTSRRWSSVDLQLFDGETLGLVGESGSGKSTLAKTILGIESPDAGGNLELDEHALAGPIDRAGRPTTSARSRWSSRTRTRRSTAAGRRGTSCQRSVSKLTGLKGKAVDERVDKLAADLRLTPAPPRPQAAPAVGRAQAARGDRPGVRRRPADRRRRRAHQRARRLGPGRDPQPAVRAAGSRARRATCSSRTTSASCATSPTGSRSCTSAGSWRSATRRRSSAARTIRTPRRCCRPSRTSTARTERADPARGRDPEPGQPADRLRLPHPLPSGHRGPVRGDRAAAHRGRAGPPDELPHPARGAAPPPGRGAPER